jgi:release factor glutamine methyltransferase
VSAGRPGAATADGGLGVARATWLYERHLEDAAPRTEFELLGRRWTALSGVFSPAHTPVTELFTSWLPYRSGSSFLEMGSGTGVTAVTAALAGCQVTALDINRAAVANTRLNAVRHGVGDRVDARHSDVFDGLAPGERFDLIYWNSNFVLMAPDFVPDSELQRAFYDAGYEAHRRFVTQAAGHLNGAGRVLLGFSDLGSWDELRAACTAAGLVPEVVRAQRRQLDVPVGVQLVELCPRARRPALDKTGAPEVA